jgi:hypothetical protein
MGSIRKSLIWEYMVVSLAHSEGVVLEGPERAPVHAEMNSGTVKGRSSGRLE